MKIIKRSGQEVTFDIDKIYNAVAKANAVVDDRDKLTNADIKAISLNVMEQCAEVSRALSVEEIQELVEDQIMKHALHHLPLQEKSCSAEQHYRR